MANKYLNLKDPLPINEHPCGSRSTKPDDVNSCPINAYSANGTW